MGKLTPAMQQYADMKKEHPDCILFFRLGDFYEMFREDAKISHKVLDLTLTSKNKKAPNPIPMAGIPHHSAEKYIQKLISKGYKVAVAEQTSLPSPGKVVERKVVSIITPGTYLGQSAENIKEAKNNYVTTLCYQKTKNDKHYHCARGDISMGKYYSKSFPTEEEATKRMVSLSPREVIVDPDYKHLESIQSITKQYNITVSLHDFPVSIDYFLQRTLQVQTLEGFGQALYAGRRESVSLLLDYIHHTQKGNIGPVISIQHHQYKNNITLDHTTIKNLELFASSYDANPKHSLFAVINNCNTSMGAKLLRQWLAYPTNNKETLLQRQNDINHFLHPETEKQTKECIETLKKTNNIPNIIASIIYRKSLPSFFLKLRDNLTFFLKGENENIKDALKHIKTNSETIEKCYQLRGQLNNTFKEEIQSEQRNYVQDGVSESIDQRRKIAHHSDKLLIEYQQELQKKTKATSIKIKYIKNAGYVIETSPREKEKIEQMKENENQEKDRETGAEKFNLTATQSLKTAQRYISPYLNDLQEKIQTAKEKLIEEEGVILSQCKEQIINHAKELIELIEKIAELDIYTSQTTLIKEKRLVQPTLLHKGTTDIRGARHLVIEHFLPHDQSFIPNDLNIKQETHIITGPNMGGKSTYLRQNAIIILLAHIGLFVPAQQAQIKIVDGIYARIGSGDAIAKNQSTFMTEMIEVANILHNATKDSFIIFDELGRGTSTYDGLALCKAILSHIVKTTNAQTLIATHYHELIALENNLPHIKNYSVSVYETDKEVIFMKKIVPGGANKSYGIEVAKLAGIPKSITTQAEQHLKELEEQNEKKKSLTKTENTLFKTTTKTNTENEQYEKIKSTVNMYDLDNITPLQALQILHKIKNETQKQAKK